MSNKNKNLITSFSFNKKITPLHAALSLKAPIQFIQALISRKPDLNIQNVNLKFSMKKKPFYLFDFFLESKSKKNIHRKFKMFLITYSYPKKLMTPLHMALKEKSTDEVVILLLKNGADTSIKDGKISLHYANTCLQIKNILDSNLVDPNIMDGNTPLHDFVIRQSYIEIQYLIDRGASVNLRNKKETPFFLACKYNHFEIAKLLVANGANFKKNAKKDPLNFLENKYKNYLIKKEEMMKYQTKKEQNENKYILYLATFQNEESAFSTQIKKVMGIIENIPQKEIEIKSAKNKLKQIEEINKQILEQIKEKKENFSDLIQKRNGLIIDLQKEVAENANLISKQMEKKTQLKELEKILLEEMKIVFEKTRLISIRTKIAIDHKQKEINKKLAEISKKTPINTREICNAFEVFSCFSTIYGSECKKIVEGYSTLQEESAKKISTGNINDWQETNKQLKESYLKMINFKNKIQIGIYFEVVYNLMWMLRYFIVDFRKSLKKSQNTNKWIKMLSQKARLFTEKKIEMERINSEIVQLEKEKKKIKVEKLNLKIKKEKHFENLEESDSNRLSILKKQHKNTKLEMQKKEKAINKIKHQFYPEMLSEKGYHKTFLWTYLLEKGISMEKNFENVEEIGNENYLNENENENIEKDGDSSLKIRVFKAQKKKGDGSWLIVKAIPLIEIEHLHREVPILVVYDHPNIIHAKMFFQENQYIHLVLPFCNKGNLYQFLLSEKKSPTTSTYISRCFQLIAIFTQILMGLNYLHSEGIYHRNLNLFNILINFENQQIVKLIGFAEDIRFKSTNSGFSEQQKRIHERYIAPEVLQGNPSNTESDMYSFGVVIYDAIFITEKTKNILFQKKPQVSPKEKLEFPDKFTNPTLENLLNRLLNTDPKKRLSAKETLLHSFFTITPNRLQEMISESDKRISTMKTLLSQSTRNRNEQKLYLNRNNMFYESVQAFNQWIDQENLFSPFRSTFDQESAIDAGGLTKDLFSMFFDFAFHPDQKLFRKNDEKSDCYLPVEDPLDRTKAQTYFVIGKAILKSMILQKPINLPMPPIFFAFLLKKENEERSLEDWLSELGHVDGELANQYHTVLLMPDASVIGFEFQNENGEDILVTNNNRREFIVSSCRKILIDNCRSALEKIREGFEISNYIRKNEISDDNSTLKCIQQNLDSFTPSELNLLICGNFQIDSTSVLNEIEFKDWKPQHKTKDFFVRFLKENDKNPNNLRRFLRYVTGLASIPIGGFKKRIFIFYSPQDQINAHTCFNNVDCPEFNDYETFEAMLLSELANLNTGRMKDF
ncbi:ovarian-specific serine/threonine-protein kinase lok-related [Anaeramoeba ignava]|uniref:Ovarian-specific serine/threonine-protein kinase lok-related n=1 Tax=Anaeramoeba ignava TaxID=1746090 RepID=A0A9Q0RIB2_ANAIG|nr:ovarian-specific serine/threonine-protein kinase lok-related [Anaeramoeba ignava]